MPDSMLNQNLSAEVKKIYLAMRTSICCGTAPVIRDFSYFVHLPDSYMEDKNPHYRLLVIIHGTGCSVEPYMKAAKELGDPNKFAIVAPLFQADLSIMKILIATSFFLIRAFGMIRSCFP